MEIKVSCYLHDSVKHPDNPELKGYTVKYIDENNQTYKRNFGPYMTWEDYELTKTLDFPSGTSKQKIKQIYDLKKKIETAEQRGKAIKEALAKRGKLSLDSLRSVIDPLIFFKLKVPIEKKLIMSEPGRPFDAEQIVEKHFPLAKSSAATGKAETTVEEVEAVEEPAPTTAVAQTTKAASSATAILNGLAPTQGQPITLAPNGAVSFDSIGELLQNHPEYVRDTFFLAQFRDFIEMGPDGKYRLNIGNFNPKRNFLDYFEETINKNKKGFSPGRERQLHDSRNTLIAFLKTLPKPKEDEPPVFSIVNGRPHISFASLNNKELLKRMDAWMIKRKKYSRSTASGRLNDIRTMYHEAADVDKVINDNFHPFRGRDRFRVPLPPRKNRGVNAKDLTKLCAYRPIKLRNWAKNSEELYYDFWFMSATAYGINQMDLLSLKKTQVKEGKFTFKRAKIEKRGGDAIEVTVIITPPLLALMEKWKSEDPNSEYYFPFLDLTEEDKIRLASVKEEPQYGIDFEIAYRREFYQIISEKVNHFTRTMNRYMRGIAKKLKLKSDITSYSARHTFANQAIDKGIPPLRVMQAMGQKCFTSFMHYVNDLMSLPEMMKMLDFIDEMHKGVTVVKETGEKYYNEYEDQYDNGDIVEEDLERVAA